VNAVSPLIPEPSSLTAPYWSGASRGTLLLQRCGACHRYQFYPRHACTSCASTELEWAEASGRGTIYSYTVFYRPPHPAFDRLPLVIALVDLEEGPRMTTNIVGCDFGEIRIGMSVLVEFEELTENVALPVFSPAN
jgi:uncharacterized OB-fold protein